MLCIISNWRR